MQILIILTFYAPNAGLISLPTFSKYSCCFEYPSYSNGTLFWMDSASCYSRSLLLGGTLSRSKARISRWCWFRRIRVKAFNSRIDLTMLTQSRSLRYLSLPSEYMVLFLENSLIFSQTWRNESQDLMSSWSLILLSVFERAFKFTDHHTI